jgi:hypothetical protein
VLVVIAAVLVGGCVRGESLPAEVTENGVRLWLAADSAGYEEAQVGGRVRYLPESNCFVVTGDELATAQEPRMYRPVFWPRGTKVVSTDPVTLNVPGIGHVTDGDVVYGGGAGGPPPPEIDIPEACFGTQTPNSVIDIQRG